MTKKIFLATDVLTAFLNRSDPKHLQSAAFFRYFAQEHFYLFTNSENIIATYQTISKNISKTLAKEFLKALLESSIHVLTPDEQDMKKALETVTTSFSEIGPAEALMLIMSRRHYIGQIATFHYTHNLFGIETFVLPI